jgi:hypothetical protein
MTRHWPTLAVGVGAFVAASALAAQDASTHGGATVTDKSEYDLFDPTPRAQMREMSTDRPDKTESPYTVDAGHFQLETDLVSYSYDHDTDDGEDTRVDAWAVTPINFKVGLLNRVDLQTVIETYNHITTRDRVAGTKVTESGFGDITSRLKINLWGNDGGSTAMAVMPFVKFPTNQDGIGNDSVEGGVIVPLAAELAAGWGIGIMTELDLNRDEDDDGHHTEFINSVTFSHGIVGTLDGYGEFFSAVSTERDSDWVGTVDLGLTYRLNENVQLDAGVNIGVTHAAEDVNPFSGLSIRF